MGQVILLTIVFAVFTSPLNAPTGCEVIAGAGVADQAVTSEELPLPDLTQFPDSNIPLPNDFTLMYVYATASTGGIAIQAEVVLDSAVADWSPGFSARIVDAEGNQLGQNTLNAIANSTLPGERMPVFGSIPAPTIDTSVEGWSDGLKVLATTCEFFYDNTPDTNRSLTLENDSVDITASGVSFHGKVTNSSDVALDSVSADAAVYREDGLYLGGYFYRDGSSGSLEPGRFFVAGGSIPLSGTAAGALDVNSDEILVRILPSVVSGGGGFCDNEIELPVLFVESPEDLPATRADPVTPEA